ncbi:MAG: 7-carboxy-7-deazaguanine synthase QueE [Dechloromonas sp.]|nr:7-carboxy-7-deazaguanine synthase QueE [Dechloromonas sp.]
MALRITEIFYSLQGEASRVGLPTTFVRLTGCPLRCTWCDTTYSFTGGEAASIDEVLAQVASYPARQVCVTGGEPLAQKECLPLLSALCDAGYEVSLETSGALDIAAVDPRVSRIVDLKAPGSGEVGRNRWANLPLLTARDELKLVLASREDYDWAVSVLHEHELAARCPVLFSPAQGLLAARELAEWVLADGLPVRFQMQLHKLLWGNMQGK